VRLYRFIK